MSHGDCSSDDDDPDSALDPCDLLFLFLPEATARREFAKLVCASNMPPRNVKCPHFLKFVHNINPLAKLGDAKSLREDCLKIYEEEKVKVKQYMKKFDGQINLSAEMLMCPKLDRYICLTAHFIDEDWKLKKWVLKYHNDDISFIGRLQKALEEWDIEDKIFTISFKSVTYSDYVDEWAGEVRDQVQKKKTLELGGQLFHVYCCAELFRMMAEDAFKVISDIIDKAKLVMWIKSEYMWHLTLSKLKDALEYRLTDEFTSQDWKDGFFELTDFPSADEWKKAESVCKLMDTLDNAAKLLFLTTPTSATRFLGILTELRTNLTGEASSLDKFGQDIAENMIQKLDKYLNDMFLVLAVCTVMDPRCKMRYIEYISTKVENGDRDSKVPTVLEAIRTLYNGYVFHKTPQNDSSSSSDSLSKCDLDSYLEESVLPWSDDFDSLNWWKEASSIYPTVSRMARDLLSISFSVITSYDAYYEEERTIDEDIRGLGQKWMDALMCTRSWASKPRDFSVLHPFISPFLFRTPREA